MGRASTLFRVILAAITLGAASPAVADRVVVKGDTLHGTVKSITSKALVKETVYGKGEITIELADVESIETEAPFHVMHGDDVRIIGPIVGVSGESIRVAEAGAAPVELAWDAVWSARRDPGPEASLLERALVELPYWSGRFDLAFSATQATDDTRSLATGLGLQRERGPHRSRLGATWRLAQQKLQGGNNDTTANELRGFGRHEFEFAPRWFAFGSGEAEYDEIEELSLRAVPRLGVGRRLYESENAWFSVDAGGAYVSERFFGGSTNQYPGPGARGGVRLAASHPGSELAQSARLHTVARGLHGRLPAAFRDGVPDSDLGGDLVPGGDREPVREHARRGHRREQPLQPGRSVVRILSARPSRARRRHGWATSSRRSSWARSGWCSAAAAAR